MPFWFFKKREDKVDKKFGDLHLTLQNSFSNIRNDMDKISKWVSHFKQKHDEHNIKHLSFHERLLRIESILEELNEKKQINIPEEKIEEIKTSLWEDLTKSQQDICLKLAALHNENPGQWVPLKYLAQEAYPNKKYDSIRSTMSEFTTTLEELGFLKKKRKGKQTFIISTEKNPYLKSKKLIKKKIKVKR